MMKNDIYLNAERYQDPTAGKAIKKVSQQPELVTWYIKTIKDLPLRYNKDKRKNPVFSRVSAFVVAYSIPFPTLIVNEKSVE